MDYIFGTYATDELKLIHHRAHRMGLQHGYALSPIHPGPGESVTASVWVGAETTVDHLVCYFSTDDQPPQGSFGHPTHGQIVRFRQVETAWDSLLWGYVTRWEATLPGQPDGTIVSYRIGGWRDGDAREYWADYPPANSVVERAADAYFQKREWHFPTIDEADSSGKTFAYPVGTLSAPAWAHHAVIYHLMCDRFYPGDGRDWTQMSALDRPMGGTLYGVRDKLGYLADLGVNCIWLSPTWVSPTAHGYDATDFMRTADHLGGDDALHALVEAAHGRGMRILLDLPCNHISSQHPVFRDAVSSPSSPYRGWFTFDSSKHGYRAYFDIPSMPVVNLANPAARDWLIETARHWLIEFEIDGYRLDYAIGPSPDFWTYFNRACKDANRDCFCFGEVVDTPQAQRAYIGRLDGCLDFFACENLRKAFAWKTLSLDGFKQAMARDHAYFPSSFVKPTFLDNHDMDRFLHIAGGDKDALRAALSAQMALPAPPILYYGTEVGLNHEVGVRTGGLEQGRLPMVWDDRQDRVLLNDVAALVHERRHLRVL